VKGDAGLLNCVRKVCKRTKEEKTKTEVEKQGFKTVYLYIPSKTTYI
jgi:hypothetical protein